jgi:hypothetical protein
MLKSVCTRFSFLARPGTVTREQSLFNHNFNVIVLHLENGWEKCGYLNRRKRLDKGENTLTMHQEHGEIWDAFLKVTPILFETKFPSCWWLKILRTTKLRVLFHSKISVVQTTRIWRDLKNSFLVRYRRNLKSKDPFDCVPKTITSIGYPINRCITTKYVLPERATTSNEQVQMNYTRRIHKNTVASTWQYFSLSKWPQIDLKFKALGFWDKKITCLCITRVNTLSL